MAQPEMDPEAFEILCRDAGASELYSCIQEAMLDQMSEKRRNLNKMRTMVIMYIMLYSQSQKCNSFQVTLSRTLQQFGISRQGLESLWNLGIVAHPKTTNILTKLSSSSHPSHVVTFIENAIKKSQFLIFCIDDHHNIHTQHRPETKTQTKVVHMSTNGCIKSKSSVPSTSVTGLAIVPVYVKVTGNLRTVETYAFLDVLYGRSAQKTRN